MEPIFSSAIPLPSPISNSSVPSYGLWRENWPRSLVTWWEAPFSSNQALSLFSVKLALWACGLMPKLLSAGGTIVRGCTVGKHCLKTLHWERTWLLSPHHWHFSRNGFGVKVSAKISHNNSLEVLVWETNEIRLVDKEPRKAPKSNWSWRNQERWAGFDVGTLSTVIVAGVGIKYH